jgi:integrase
LKAGSETALPFFIFRRMHVIRSAESLGEVRRLLGHIARAIAWRLGTNCFSLYALTGFRCSEILSLHMTDYDRVSRVLRPLRTKRRIERCRPIRPRLAQRLHALCDLRRRDPFSEQLFVGRRAAYQRPIPKDRWAGGLNKAPRMSVLNPGDVRAVSLILRDQAPRFFFLGRPPLRSFSGLESI